MAPQLTADYTAPSLDLRTFSSPLPAISDTPSTSDRTAFLEALQTSAVGLQDEINEFLTKKIGRRECGERETSHGGSQAGGELRRKSCRRGVIMGTASLWITSSVSA